MSESPDLLAIKVSFETTIPPGMTPDNQLHPYDLNSVPFLNRSMLEKIENNIKQFGTVEKFLEQFQKELAAMYDAAESAVRVYHMRRIQMEFLVEWVKKNATTKDPSLDR